MPDEFDDRGEPVMTAEEPPVMPPPPAPMPVQSQPFPVPVAAGAAPMSRGVPSWMQDNQGPESPLSAGGERAINQYMTQMAQLGQMKQAEADVSSAMRFLGMRGMERDIRSGVPHHVAIANNLPYLTWGHPEHIPAYMRAVQAASRPITVAPVAPVGPVQGQQVLDTLGAPVPGLIATPGVRGGNIVHRLPPAQATASPATERLALKDQIRYKTEELEQAKTDLQFLSEKKNKPEFQAQKAKINALTSEKDALISKVGGPKEEKVSGPLIEPKTKEEYDQIPKGTRYHHPDDPPGKFRVKKHAS